MTEPAGIQLTTQAQKDLKVLWKVSETVTKHLKELILEPLKGHPLTGDLDGALALHFTMKGSGQFRAGYFFYPDENVVIVFIVGPHENFYREAKRREKHLKDLFKKAREAKKSREDEKKAPTKKPAKA